MKKKIKFCTYYKLLISVSVQFWYIRILLKIYLDFLLKDMKVLLVFVTLVLNRHAISDVADFCFNY